MKENTFQGRLIKDLKERYPEFLILKNDPNYIQGVPDITILGKERWAALECKRSENSTHRPNQEYYVDKMNKLGYASFIYPENKDEVIYKLDEYFDK